jgi:hypothetical protein
VIIRRFFFLAPDLKITLIDSVIFVNSYFSLKKERSAPFLDS